MKRYLLLLLTLVSAFANGQITLTHSDFQSGFGVGVVFQTLSTPLGSDYEVFVGEPSSNAQFWDMTSIPFEYVAISNSVEPSSAPFIGDFPSSNLVLYERYWFGPEDTLYTWNYKELQSDRLLLHGESDETSVSFTWDPPAIQSMIPMTLGTTWMSERDSTYYMPEVYVISESEMTVDAFGTLKISSGEFPCLRIRQDHLSISHTPVGIDTAQTRSFGFYTKEMLELHVATILEDQFDLTTIWTSGIKLSGRQGSVGLPALPPPLQPILTGLCPNPAHELVELHYFLNSNSMIGISVTDLSGKEILFNNPGRQTAGDHKAILNVSGIPPGIYFCRIKANDRVETRKLFICR
ncbi:MAG: T9SS type A sorting domain-containing protein [Bacteroidota bacterium]